MQALQLIRGAFHLVSGWVLHEGVLDKPLKQLNAVGRTRSRPESGVLDGGRLRCRSNRLALLQLRRATSLPRVLCCAETKWCPIYSDVDLMGTASGLEGQRYRGCALEDLEGLLDLGACCAGVSCEPRQACPGMPRPGRELSL